MISICMNDRQQVITNVGAGASVCQEISMYLSYFFFIIIVFFSSLKNYYCIFLVLIYFLK